MFKLDVGKYRGIIISVALFLLLDSSVLVLNFVMSYQISADAAAVNLAGRQRMLSQRIMKSLLDIQYTIDNVDERQRPLQELATATTLFDTTLLAFENGGQTRDANGLPYYLPQVSSITAQELVAQGGALWRPFHDAIETFLIETNKRTNSQFAPALTAAIAYGQAQNLPLLKLMNDLTINLESKASAKATRLRVIQTVGISLAVLNFLIILLHFLRQLKSSDQSVDSARKETQEILSTVNEGLFLLDANLIIGQQHSAKLFEIFGMSQIAGLSFEALLKGFVAEKDLATANSFVKLLFKPTINQNLIGELNPLDQVEIHLPDSNGQYHSKFLKFNFSRVNDTRDISHILATVIDISRQVELTKELQQVRNQNEQQFEMLSTIVQANGDLVPLFINNSLAVMARINTILKQKCRSHVQYMEKVHQIYRLIHGFKGEASALSLTLFSDYAHKFEDRLDQLRALPKLTGNDFLSLAIMLNQLLKQLESADQLIHKLTKLVQEPGHPGQVVAPVHWDHLQQLADDIASRQNKSVDLVLTGLNDYPLSDSLVSIINSTCSQLIRNAITHGIETIPNRIALQKPETSELLISLAHTRNGEWRLRVQDDGCGLDLESLRERAIATGNLTEDASELLDHKQLMQLIFLPSVSTSNTINIDAGRGVGMSVVSDIARTLRGKVNIASRTNRGCTFTLTFPNRAILDAEAA
ncbi:ATP-binding protein [Reinekea sp.]|uniref:ATP-binding protein n=1 Tax=Reinekea sp. TaxID=1970455 RepID=UPI002A807158|nr:ATP-binding protein [Reinekea sp.]